MTEKIIQARQEVVDFFETGQTLDLDFRLEVLKKLYDLIRNSQDAILQALKDDLNKAPTEGYMTEVGQVLSDISHTRKKLKSWAKPRKVKASLSQFPARVRIHPEPYGTVLVMSPWNYPFLLSIGPLIAAIAAGNTVLLKPSAYSPATSALLKTLLEGGLPQGLVRVIEGGREENQALLDQKFDYIFFTGSPSVGKEVMAKAAVHLTPVTLELGGKSPVIIDETANIDLAAKRVAFGKLVNAGQTCIAPDYVFVHKDKREEFIEKLKEELAVIHKSPEYYRDNYPKMIQQKHFDRILGLLQGQNIIYGGKSDPMTRQIEPTLVLNPDPSAALMQEEIFGPVLPIMDYEDFDEVVRFIKVRPKPLALYHFTEDQDKEAYVNKHISFGGGCVNDCILHQATTEAPFGGVGNSGLGKYHGKFGFEELSHLKTVIKKGSFLDMPFRYHPYKKTYLPLLRKLVK